MIKKQHKTINLKCKDILLFHPFSQNEGEKGTIPPCPRGDGKDGANNLWGYLALQFTHAFSFFLKLHLRKTDSITIAWKVNTYKRMRSKIASTLCLQCFKAFLHYYWNVLRELIDTIIQDVVRVKLKKVLNINPNSPHLRNVLMPLRSHMRSLVRFCKFKGSKLISKWPWRDYGIKHSDGAHVHESLKLRLTAFVRGLHAGWRPFASEASFVANSNAARLCTSNQVSLW